MLANVVRKPLRQIFSEFAGAGPDGESKEYFGTGDVKYHLGTSYDRPTASGKRVHLSLLANPSHLEVSPLLSHSQESCVATIRKFALTAAGHGLYDSQLQPTDWQVFVGSWSRHED